MATTTNYGWETPDDTDLVKDGASAIRTLGSAIDTTTKALNPETTLGDISYRSSTSNMNTRLAIGTSGQVLTVSSGVPAWAAPVSGGMTLLSTTTLSGGTQVVISNVDQSYKDLVIIVAGVTNATANSGFTLTLNTSGVTDTFRRGTATTVATATAESLNFNAAENILRTDADNCWRITISDYSSTTRMKAYMNFGGYYNASSVRAPFFGAGIYRSTTAVSTLTFDHYGGDFSTGTVLVYGVK